MDLSRLRPGELVAGLAALALLASLFLDWDRDHAGDGAITGAGRHAAQAGWSSLGVVFVILVLVLVGVAASLVFFTVRVAPAALPIGAAVITTFVGALIVPILAIRVITLDDSLGGAYLGLLFAFLVPVGGWLTMRDERLEAPYSAAPDLPRRPAPPVGA